MEKGTEFFTTATKKLEQKKSVHFPTTSTSTTTLPSAEPIRRLGSKLNTLLSVLIKQTRSSIKAEHHIELLQIPSGEKRQKILQIVGSTEIK